MTRDVDLLLATLVAITTIYCLWKLIRFTRHELVVATRTLVRILMFMTISFLVYAVRVFISYYGVPPLLLESLDLASYMAGIIALYYLVVLVRA